MAISTSENWKMRDNNASDYAIARMIVLGRIAFFAHGILTLLPGSHGLVPDSTKGEDANKAGGCMYFLSLHLAPRKREFGKSETTVEAMAVRMIYVPAESLA